MHTLVSRKSVQSFSKKTRTLWYLEFVKVFNFSDKKPGFSKIIELCLNFIWDYASLNYYYPVMIKSVHTKTVLY